MKKIVQFIGLVVLIALIGHAVEHNSIAHVYPRAATVIEIDEENGTMLLEDIAGLTWKADAEDFWFGDNVAMLMHDNDTPDWIYDDIILSIR